MNLWDCPASCKKGVWKVYIDNSPIPNFPYTEDNQVVVLEGGERASEVIEFARENEVTTNDGEDEIFWIVFSNNPQRVWDFTGKSLRRTLWDMRRQQS